MPRVISSRVWWLITLITNFSGDVFSDEPNKSRFFLFSSRPQSRKVLPTTLQQLIWTLTQVFSVISVWGLGMAEQFILYLWSWLCTVIFRNFSPQIYCYQNIHLMNFQLVRKGLTAFLESQKFVLRMRWIQSDYPISLGQNLKQPQNNVKSEWHLLIKFITENPCRNDLGPPKGEEKIRR